jgi:hypothetical protein
VKFKIGNNIMLAMVLLLTSRDYLRSRDFRNIHNFAALVINFVSAWSFYLWQRCIQTAVTLHRLIVDQHAEMLSRWRYPWWGHPVCQDALGWGIVLARRWVNAGNFRWEINPALINTVEIQWCQTLRPQLICTVYCQSNVIRVKLFSVHLLTI